MFKELFALTERAPVLLLLARDGDKLRVNLTRKTDKDEKDVPLSLSILATPEELDAELPLALAEGFALSEASKKAVSVADQVKGQVAAAAADETKPVKKKHVPATRQKKQAAKAKKAAAKSAPKTKKQAAQRPAIAPLIKPIGTPTSAKKKAEKKPRKAQAAKGVLVPTRELADVIGVAAITYNDAMSKVWAYIKANNLQDAKNKRKIAPDERLAALADGGKLAVENLGARVKAHLLTPSPEIVAAVNATPKITPLLTPEKLAAAAITADTTQVEEPRRAQQQPIEPPPPPAAKPTGPLTSSDPESVELFS
jgi:upstream activation factor subunit UAF30